MANRHIGAGLNWKEERRFALGICALLEAEETYGGPTRRGKEEGARDGSHFRILSQVRLLHRSLLPLATSRMCRLAGHTGNHMWSMVRPTNSMTL